MSTRKGGRALDDFIYEHYSTVGERTPAKRWNMRCNYCPESAKTILHRDQRCLTHLSKPGSDGSCPNAPADVRSQARSKLMAKGGIEIPQIDSDIEIIDVDTAVSEAGPSSSKRTKISKAQDSSQATSAKRDLNSYLDRSMTTGEIDKANINLLRYVIIYCVFQVRVDMYY